MLDMTLVYMGEAVFSEETAFPIQNEICQTETGGYCIYKSRELDQPVIPQEIREV